MTYIRERKKGKKGEMKEEKERKTSIDTVYSSPKKRYWEGLTQDKEQICKTYFKGGIGTS